MDTYEKKYKEAFKEAEKIHKFSSDIAEIKRMEQIFPELKESEDERMRNVAINACKYMVDNFENSTKQYEEALAWLEKQGEKLPAGFYYVNSKGEKFYSNKFKYGNVTLSIEKQDEIDNVPPQNLGNCVVTNSNK